jgi:predicted DNA-binding transcriptional regulator AlpA
MTPAAATRLVDVDELCRVYGLSREWIDQQLAHGRLPPPRRRDGQMCWTVEEAWRGIAALDPATAARVPLRFWPLSMAPPPGRMRSIRGGMVQDWYIDEVTLRVVWPLHAQPPPSLAEAAAMSPPVPRVLQLGYDFGPQGPALGAHNPLGNPAPDADGSASEGWADYAAVVGGTAPYWPSALRVPDVMQQWQPGATAPEVAAIPVLDTVPLLRLAAALPDGSPAQRVLLNLALTVQYNATSEAQWELQHLVDEGYTKAVPGAVAMPVPKAGQNDLPEDIQRAGWLEILGRRDALAIAAIREVCLWDGGAMLPVSTQFQPVDLLDPHSQEWTERLQRVENPAAIYQVVSGGHEVAEHLVDPATDAPVCRMAGQEHVLEAGVPQALPASSPLAELILKDTIWIRAEDGTLYIAPHSHSHGLSWGYGGTGPRTLALLIHRLLDDVNARAVDPVIEAAPEGLIELTQQKWPAGTVFTRDELQAARAGEPYGPVSTNGE